MKPVTVYALHTGFVLVEPLKPLFRELIPNARVVNLVDDSLLADVRAAGRVTPAVTRRMIGYGTLAQGAGADAIFNCCSSVGEAADLMAAALDIPVVKIDDRMASEAARLGHRAAVIGTVATTLDPTTRLVRRKAGELGRDVTVRAYLVEGAFDCLMAGDAAAHDRMVLDTVHRAAAENDVVCLAQGSMARLVPLLGTTPVPVMSSPRLGVDALRDVLASSVTGTLRTP